MREIAPITSYMKNRVIKWRKQTMQNLGISFPRSMNALLTKSFQASSERTIENAEEKKNSNTE